MTILDSFNPAERLVIDVETTSGDDKRAALQPYSGDRISGIAIAQGERAMYLPLRHRTQQDQCYPLEAGLAEFREFALKVKHLENVNLKFDLHCFHQDNIEFPNAEFHELQTKARLVYNKYETYNLFDLSNRYCTKYKKDGEPVEEWCKAHATEDYGAVPLDIISTYAKLDALAAYELSGELERLMPKTMPNMPGSEKAWAEERRFTRLLFDSERDGLLLDTKLFNTIAIELLKRMQVLQEQIGVVTANTEFNPASPKQVDEYFRSKGIAPVAWNISKKTGEKTPSWNADALSQIIDPVANLLISYKAKQTACSTFAQGWVNQLSPDGRLHGHYNQSGAKTSRITSSKPNLQNPPPWAMYGLQIPEGEIGIKFDYSQIEYRIFAHFSQDEGLLKMYNENPKTDFHQMIANRLGMNDYRGVIKPINFGILYGMGKGKMKKQLAKTIHDLKDDFAKKGCPEKYDALRHYLEYQYGGGQEDPSLEMIGGAIIDEYHRLTPAVKKLLNFVKSVIGQRGNIRNYYGRFFQFDLDHAYVALNYLCQGTAADMFKERSNAIFYHPRIKALGAKLRLNIHDAIYATMPVESAQEYWNIVKPLACDVPGFRVPVLIDGEVAYSNWGTTSKIKDNNAVAETFAVLRGNTLARKAKYHESLPSD